MTVPAKMKYALAAFLFLGAAAATGGTRSDLESCIASNLPQNVAPADRLKMAETAGRYCYGVAMDALRLDEQAATNSIYANQTFQNRILLFMVVFLTLAGVVLSALQLWASYRLASEGRGQLAEGGEIGLTGANVAVKSSVVGVVILGLSLGFFAIFATEVYRLRPIDLAPDAQTAAGDVNGAATTTDEPPAGSNEVGP